MKELLASLTKQKETLLIYAKSKLDAQDFHAVADACMDLREIDAQIKMLFIIEQQL